MIEAVEALMIWAEENLGAQRIQIRVDDRNQASWRIPERLGFRLEGVMRNQVRDNAGKLAAMRLYAWTPGASTVENSAAVSLADRYRLRQ